MRRHDEDLLPDGRALLLPALWAGLSRRAVLFLSSALSGGSLEGRLREAAGAWGPDRLALCLERRAEAFPLPAPTGEGRPLSREELEELLARREPAVFFSQALCAHYFTLPRRGGGAEFVLFDTAESLRRKRELARSLGIRRFLLLCPQTEDLLPALLAPGPPEGGRG